MVETLKTNLLRKENLVPLGLCFGAGLIWKFVVPKDKAISIYEKINHRPQLQSLGLAMYALYTGVSILINAQTLIERGFNSGIKSTLVFNSLNTLSPTHRKTNACLAETLNAIYNIIGFTHFGVTANFSDSVLKHSSNSILTQRLTAMAINGPVNLGINIGLLLQKYK